MPQERRGEDGRPPEVDEADWLESHQEPGAPPGPAATGEPLGDRLQEADEGDLLESGAEEPAGELPGDIPADAPVADVLEQHQRPTGGDDEEEWREDGA